MDKIISDLKRVLAKLTNEWVKGYDRHNQDQFDLEHAINLIKETIQLIDK